MSAYRKDLLEPARMLLFDNLPDYMSSERKNEIIRLIGVIPAREIKGYCPIKEEVCILVDPQKVHTSEENKQTIVQVNYQYSEMFGIPQPGALVEVIGFVDKKCDLDELYLVKCEAWIIKIVNSLDYDLHKQTIEKMYNKKLLPTG